MLEHLSDLSWTASFCQRISDFKQENSSSLFLVIKPTGCTDLSKFILGMKLYMFQTVPLSIIRSFSLYTQQWYMSYRFADILWAGSGWNTVPSCSYTTAMCKAENSDDGRRNCMKHIEFHSKKLNFEKLVHLVGFITRNLTRWTVTWTSKTPVSNYMYPKTVLWVFAVSQILYQILKYYFPLHIWKTYIFNRNLHQGLEDNN